MAGGYEIDHGVRLYVLVMLCHRHHLLGAMPIIEWNDS